MRQDKVIRSLLTLIAGLWLLLAGAPSALAQTPAKKPNILVIWGDDIGIHNISAYNLGLMGYKTPGIDRIAKEGALFAGTYAQQRCGLAEAETGRASLQTD